MGKEEVKSFWWTPRNINFTITQKICCIYSKMSVTRALVAVSCLVLGVMSSHLYDVEEEEFRTLINEYLDSENRDLPTFGDAPIYEPNEVINDYAKREENPFMKFGLEGKSLDSENRDLPTFGDAPTYEPNEVINDYQKREDNPFMKFGGPVSKSFDEEMEDAKREDPVIGFGNARREDAPMMSFGDAKREYDEEEDKREDAPMMSFGRSEEMEIYSNMVEGAKRVADEPAPVEKRAGGFHINMCYFCDATCLATLKASPQGAVNYLGQVTNGIQDRVRTLMGASTTVSMQGYLLKFPVPARTYLLFKSGSFKGKGLELLSNVATNFWKVWVPARYTNKKPLYDFTSRQGCDVNFLIVSRYDALWGPKYAGRIDGEASTMGICAKHSFGMVKLNPDPVMMATLISHEVGHLLGLYHDAGPLEAGWAGNCAKFPGMPVCPALTSACKNGNHGCPNGEGNCIMNPAVGTESQYSACSKAYWAGFQLLTKVMPNAFSLSCIKN